MENVVLEKFEIKLETALTKKLNKLFTEEQELIGEEELFKREHIGVFYPALVCCCSAKTTPAKLILRQFIDKEKDSFKLPKLSYEPNKYSPKSKFNPEYLKRILDIFACFGEESVDISVNNDYPITIENKHFCFILAPRIGN